MKIVKKFILLEDFGEENEKVFRITFKAQLEDYDDLHNKIRLYIAENDILKEEIEVEE